MFFLCLLYPLESHAARSRCLDFMLKNPSTFKSMDTDGALRICRNSATLLNQMFFLLH